MPYAYYVELPLRFPEGVHLGAGKLANTLTVSRDGQQQPVLNGTSLAGVLRTLWRDHLDPDHRTTDKDDPTNPLFGRALGDGADDSGEESCVKVSNYLLDLGEAAVTERTHHQRNRHRGTVLEDALFSVECCPPETKVSAGFWVRDQRAVVEDDIDQFIRVVRSAFRRGLRMGGSSNRGFGRVELSDEVAVRRFDLTNINEHSEYVTAHRQWRLAALKPSSAVTGGTVHDLGDGQDDSLADDFCITLTLGIPRGQDLLVGDGQADEVQIEPQRTRSVDGTWSWRIPGASVRGMLRGWFHRLAALDGQNETFADQASEYRQRERDGTYRPVDIANGFGQDDRCPITSLFGNVNRPGRLKISDGLSRCSSEGVAECDECQDRIHVAVDRITGGTAPGMLFKNRVLINSAEESPQFTFDLKITCVTPDEIKWLARSLIALHAGILRVGSSKSSGRLEVVDCRVVASERSQEFLDAVKSHFAASHAN